MPGRARGRRSPAMLVTFWILLLTAVAQTAIAAEPISAQLAQQFLAFSRAVNAPTDNRPDLKRAATWLQAANDTWVYTIDLAGNRSFRRREIRIAETVPSPIKRTADPFLVPRAIGDRLIEQTRRLAEVLAGVRGQPQGTVHLKQEVVLVCRRESGDVRRHAGRYLVRLNGLPRRAYFQVMYGTDLKPVRINTNVRDPACAKLADAIADQPPDPTIASWHEDREPLTVGTFFCPSELRFELKAYSYEGVPFLDLSQRRDPFASKDWQPIKGVVDTAGYRLSQDYHHWCWVWWTRYGRVGAVRGNWDPQAEQWEHPGVEVRLHRSFADYPIKGGEPRDRPSTPRNNVNGPPGYCEEFTPEFYEDLERCNIAHLSSHGGHVGGRYRFARTGDVWVKFEPPAGCGLGHNQLRHLFVEGCGTMTFLAEPRKRLLLDTWIQSRYIDGVRTICGTDGGYGALDRSGWRFYGYYNKGESISDAWALGMQDENIDNDPVTAAYGPTRQEAIETLQAGRFTRQRAEPKWAAVSIWGTPPEWQPKPQTTPAAASQPAARP